MTPDLWLSIINFALKFGIDAAIALVTAIKPGATIDDAIAALGAAKVKSAADYISQAKAIAASTTPTT